MPSARASVVPARRIEPSGSRTAPLPSAAPSCLGVDRAPARSAGPAPRPSRRRASRDRRGSPPPRRADAALGVGVVDPQHERATVLVGEGAVGDGTERVAEVERAGRARREADANRHRRRQASIAMCPGWAATRSEPRPDRGVAGEVEVALVRHVRVGVERDVGHRVAARRRGTCARRDGAPSRRARRSRSRSALRCARRASRPRPSRRAGSGRPRSTARAGTARRTATGAPARARSGRRARTRCRRRGTRGSRSTRQRPAVVEHERRHPPGGVEVAEHLGAIRAVDDAQLVELEREPEVGGEEAHLVAVAGDGGVVEEHRRLSHRERRWGSLQTQEPSRATARSRASGRRRSSARSAAAACRAPRRSRRSRARSRGGSTRNPTGASLVTASVPRKSRSPSASDASAPHVDPERRRDGAKRHPGAGNERLEEHVARAEAHPVAAVAGWSPASCIARPVCDRARDPRAERPGRRSVTSGLAAPRGSAPSAAPGAPAARRGPQPHDTSAGSRCVVGRPPPSCAAERAAGRRWRRAHDRDDLQLARGMASPAASSRGRGRRARRGRAVNMKP